MSLLLVVTPGRPGSPPALADGAGAEPSSTKTSGISSGCPGRAVCHPADKGPVRGRLSGTGPSGHPPEESYFGGLSLTPAAIKRKFS